MARRNFVAWRYKTSNDVEYVRRADSRLVTQLNDDGNPKVGGSTAAGLSPYEEMPRNLKPRHVVVKETGVDFKTSVVIYTQAAMDLLLTGTSTINVFDAGGTSHTCVVLEKVGEGARGPIGA